MVGGLQVRVLFAVVLMLSTLTACGGSSTEAPTFTWFQDNDGDGYTTGATQVSTEQPTGYVLETALVNTYELDCDDLSAAINPGATDHVDGLDNNCAGDIDENKWFPFAFSSFSGTVSGNIRAHWGDVAVRGTLETSARLIAKGSAPSVLFNGESYMGGSPSDRFVDFYVGHTDDTAPYPDGHIIDSEFDEGDLSLNYLPQPNTLPVLQFYEAHKYGNYFSNLSDAKIHEMLLSLDYEILRGLAIQRDDHNAYWVTAWEPGSRPEPRLLGLYNPRTGVMVASIEELLDNPESNPNYDGDFIFIDSWGSTTDYRTFGVPVKDPSATPLEMMDTWGIHELAANDLLPTHEIGGALDYTTGVIYVAGNINFGGMGRGMTIAARTPPRSDLHYEHNLPGRVFFEDELPICPDPKEEPEIFDLDVNINGAIYINGYFDGIGAPKVYGALTAERGYRGPGAPEIWYNYFLNPGATLLPENP